IPAICNLGLRRFLTRSMVLDSAPMPSSARNSACRGTSAASTATRAFSVTRPSEGGQSTSTVVQRWRASPAAPPSASARRYSRRSMSMSSISAPASDTAAGITARPGICEARTQSPSGARPSRNSYEPGERSLLEMPRPVEALPWGSRSISRTCSPTAASAVARLIAVVVLPTPPFWLAMAKTCGFVGPELENDGVTVGYAGEGLIGNLPVLHGLGQFPLPVFPFVEKANSGIGSMAVGPIEELPKRRKRPGGQDVGWCGRDRLNPADPNGWGLGQPHLPRRFTQEGGFAGIGLDQGDVEIGTQGGQHQSGETGAAAQVRQMAGGGWDQGLKLRRIQDVADPDVTQGAPAHEI